MSFLKRHPISLALIALLLALALRLVDIFVLRLDELLGEIILSKALGFLLVLGAMRCIQKKVYHIGLHSARFGTCMAIGFALNIAIYLLAYGIEYLVLLFSQQNPTLLFAAIDPKQGLQGGGLFMAWLLLGNVVNALMEEGLFRGLLLPTFKTRHSFWKANLIQALLFGAWHLVWPLKSFLTGDQSFAGAMMSGLIIMLGTATFGFIWGYMLEKSNSLWMPIAAHFAANTIQNVLHIQSSGGMDAMVSLRGTFASLIGIACIFVIAKLVRVYKLPSLIAWDADSTSREDR